ncbi:winged helix-turn-helix transcriptional regulator [Actinoallomurus sp. CA-150999]|uniref:winged helix-turn-helix transcriptional regulator n=1 Tax=Actinoallomurus sp. CA-150999 TaxID=3239887 RepID=UPI003D906BBB
MALGKDYVTQDCALARALELLGERWTLLIVRDAFYGVRRYGDFLAHLDIPRAVLAARLQALVDAGVLDRRPYQESPRRHEYVLTERGRELWPALNALGHWGGEYLSPAGPTRLYTHLPCGARVDRTGTCVVCGRFAPPEELEVRPGPGADRPHRNDPVSRALRRPHRLLEPLLTE